MLNAFVTASAAVPASLLAYAVTGRRWPALAAGLASAALPWLVLSSFGLREAASYAVFAVALLAVYRSVAAPGLLNDSLALAGLAFATVVRPYLVVLFLVPPLAVLVHELGSAPGRGLGARAGAGLRNAFTRHRALAAAYLALVLFLFALDRTGNLVRVFGTDANIARDVLSPPGLRRAFAQHTAGLALELAILPALVAAGWLVGALGRSADPRRHAFAAVGTVALVVVLLHAASVDLRFAFGEVREEYFFFVAPILAVAVVCALVPLRWPRLTLAAAVLAWLGLGLGLSRITTRVNDWFVMTDELLYERLAISIARTGSPLPRIHGEAIESFNQLYPILLSRVYRIGFVPDALHDAHVLNAFVMTSAAVPAYLLARSVTGRSSLALGAAVLTVLVPWLTLSSFLLTEVVAYPMFVWAVLGSYRSVALPGMRNDALALIAIALAALARVQFLVLLAVLPLAVVLHEAGSVRAGARDALRRHRLLVVAYAALAVGAVALAATGEISRVLGSYAQTAQGAFPPGLPRAFVEHLGEIALSLAILPFLVAAGWVLATIGRGGDPRRHAFASVAVLTVVLLTLQVASFNERFGAGIVRDRYLFYVVPVLLVALACALIAPDWPRWSLLVPTALVGAGFALYELPRFEKLNVDTPISVLHDRIVALGGSAGGARLGLVLATVVLVLLFAQGAARLGRASVAAVLAAMVVFALPAETTYAFSRLFAVPGTSGRELDHDQAGVFNWVDRMVGRDADVTMVPYPHLYGDYWAAVAFWWDLEFWNVSVVRAASIGTQFQGTPPSFPKLKLSWDEQGVLNVSPTRYVTQFVRESRFRISGEVVGQERETYLIEAGQSWRLDWATEGLYADGWTKPDTEASVTVFAAPGQAGPVTRRLTVTFDPPGVAEERPVRIASNLAEAAIVVTDATLPAELPVCVPAQGSAVVRFSVVGAAPILGNPVSIEAYARPRWGGLPVRQIDLGDAEPGCSA